MILFSNGYFSKQKIFDIAFKTGISEGQINIQFGIFKWQLVLASKVTITSHVEFEDPQWDML